MQQVAAGGQGCVFGLKQKASRQGSAEMGVLKKETQDGSKYLADTAGPSAQNWSILKIGTAKERVMENGKVFH